MKMEIRTMILMNQIWKWSKMEVNGDTWLKESKFFYNLVATWNQNIMKLLTPAMSSILMQEKV